MNPPTPPVTSPEPVSHARFCASFLAMDSLRPPAKLPGVSLPRYSLSATRRLSVYLLFVQVVLGCGSNQAVTLVAHGPRPQAEIDEAGRPNAAAFFRKPMISHVRLSPDGRRLAGVIVREGLEIIVVYPLDGGELQPVAKLERTEQFKSWTVGQVGWGSNERLLVSVRMPSYRQDRIKSRQSRLLVVNTVTGATRYLGDQWPKQAYIQYQDRIISFLPQDPGAVLIALWTPGQFGVGARRVKLSNGKLKTIAVPLRGTLGWAVDHRGDVRVGWGQAARKSRNFILARTDADQPFKEILSWNPYQDRRGFSFAGFARDPRTIYVYARSERGRTALYPFDLVTRTMGSVLFDHPSVDVGRISTSQVDGRLVSIEYDTDKPQIHFFDKRRERLQEEVDAALPDRLNRFISSDLEERRYLIASSSDISPPSYYLYEPRTNNLELLFDAYPELSKAKLAPVVPIRYRSRDGLEIPGYLTRPIDGSKAPHPLIVMPHGGPWTRDVWGWNPVVQFLASRGFAVLQPNFRGSTGYGVRYLSRGRGRWGLEMQDDVTDAAIWAVRAGIADRNRVGIYGASYGGYAALRALQKEPELFRAGASFAGVTDIPMMLDDDALYYSVIDDMEALVGDRRSDRTRLEASSPANGAAQIRGAVLLAHGTEDPTVHMNHATRMAEALERAGHSAETYLYEGEVHGFLDERNEVDFYTRLAAFFARHLRPTADSVDPHSSPAGGDNR